MVVVIFIFLLLFGGLGGGAYYIYSRKLHRAKAIERGLKMVPVQIHLPPQSSDTTAGGRDLREVMRETTSQAKTLYDLLAGTATAEGFKSRFYGQRHIGLELVASGGLIYFYAAVPVALVSVVEKSIQTAYPGARLEEVEDHNIFNRDGRLAATMGGELVLRAEAGYPIASYEELERDPMSALITTLSALEKGDGAAIQVMLRPAGTGWVARSKKLADSIRTGKPLTLTIKPEDLLKAVLSHKPGAEKPVEAPHVMTSLEQALVERIEKKTRETGFEVLVRIVVSTQTVATSQQLVRDLSTAFALFESPGSNGFKFLPAVDVQGLVTAFILRFFPPELRSNVLNTSELATLFHLPDAQFVPTANVARLASKEVDGPVSLPASGLLFGYNEFRGVKKEIRLSFEDRRRHTYILGQTGTGKSTMLENLITQDMRSGNGFAFIDPHGDSAEKLLSLVPKERAEDVIYFNPADTDYPLGLNLFEFDRPEQKDFIVQETINMLYKLYDPGHTGIIGPRYEHWYRNAALTLMSDPNGATFIEIPKVFTDTDYLKQKFRYLKDPTVIDFWTKEMGQTSDYHKSEMLGWFVSKFGAFQNNEMMRNIIGQTKSSFNLRDVMDNKKILIVNLSKGRIGELNSQLLGMIFVIKFQAAAMARADMPEAQRNDFALYVDEFQNFSTDSFASILSEARKYRLNLIVANQFIGQLTPEIRDAVFGNIGTIVAHRMGPEDAEFMTKQFAPVFDASDLVNIPNYHSVMRLMNGGLPSQPFTVANAPYQAGGNPELGGAIKQLSAAKFGAAKVMVEVDIATRLSGAAPVLAAPVAAEAPALAAAAPAPTEPVTVPAAQDQSTSSTIIACEPVPVAASSAPVAAVPMPDVAATSGPDASLPLPPVADAPSTALEPAEAIVMAQPAVTPASGASAANSGEIPSGELSFGDITGSAPAVVIEPPVASPDAPVTTPAATPSVAAVESVPAEAWARAQSPIAGDVPVAVPAQTIERAEILPADQPIARPVITAPPVPPVSVASESASAVLPPASVATPVSLLATAPDTAPANTVTVEGADETAAPPREPAQLVARVIQVQDMPRSEDPLAQIPLVADARPIEIYEPAPEPVTPVVTPQHPIDEGFVRDMPLPEDPFAAIPLVDDPTLQPAPTPGLVDVALPETVTMPVPETTFNEGVILDMPVVPSEVAGPSALEPTSLSEAEATAGPVPVSMPEPAAPKVLVADQPVDNDLTDEVTEAAPLPKAEAEASVPTVDAPATGSTDPDADMAAAAALGLKLSEPETVPTPAAPVAPDAPTIKADKAAGDADTDDLTVAEAVGLKLVETAKAVPELAPEPAPASSKVQIPATDVAVVASPALMSEPPVDESVPVPAAEAARPAERSADEVLKSVMRAAAERQGLPAPEAPVEPVRATPAATTATDPGDAVAAVEDRIDDLLGTSLIKADASRPAITLDADPAAPSLITSTHHRLADNPAVSHEAHDELASDVRLRSGGHAVIRPLEASSEPEAVATPQPAPADVVATPEAPAASAAPVLAEPAVLTELPEAIVLTPPADIPAPAYVVTAPSERKAAVVLAPQAVAAGSVILPSAQPRRPAAPAPATPMIAPPHLAKGEVFVDALGNVVIGE